MYGRRSCLIQSTRLDFLYVVLRINFLFFIIFIYLFFLQSGSSQRQLLGAAFGQLLGAAFGGSF